MLVGWVAEWSKAAVLKTAVPVRVPWVRIPAHPFAAARDCQLAALLQEVGEWGPENAKNSPKPVNNG